MAEKGRIRLLVESVADYEKEMDAKVWESFPLVVKADDENLVKIRRRELIHASFSLKQTEPEIISELISESLLRAGVEGISEWSTHGAEHLVYKEALDAARKSLHEGNGTFIKQQSTKLVGKDVRPTETLVFEGGVYERVTALPKPYIEALKLKTGNFKEITSYARDLALNKDYGYGYSILFLIYKGVAIEQIVKILSNKEWLRNNSKKIQGKVIYPSNDEGIRYLGRARDTLLTQDALGSPIFSYASADYYTALGLLQIAGVFPYSLSLAKGGVKGTAYGFTEMTQTARPKIVFTGLMEIAEGMADRDYRDPRRHDHIVATYGDKFTTVVKTAYLVFN